MALWPIRRHLKLRGTYIGLYNWYFVQQNVLVSSNEVVPGKSGPWYSSLKWRLTISLSALGLGILFATTACMYPLRVVQRLTYVGGKGGQVGITTFSPFKGSK